MEAGKSCFKLSKIGFLVELVNINAIGFYFESLKDQDLTLHISLEQPVPEVLRVFKIMVIYAASLGKLKTNNQKGTSIQRHTALCAGWHTFVYYVAAYTRVLLVDRSIAASGPRPLNA